MDIDLNTLLVALMFITILSMGIGNILMSLADIFNHATSSRRDRVHIGWILLLLIVHFNLFWNTKAILEVEDWEFAGFLMTMAGPVLLFFATSIMLTNPSEKDQDLTMFFRHLGRRFFVMFAALQAWVLGVAYALGGSLQAGDTINVVFLVLALFLAWRLDSRTQFAGIWLAWILGLGGLAFRWVGA